MLTDCSAPPPTVCARNKRKIGSRRRPLPKEMAIKSVRKGEFLYSAELFSAWRGKNDD